MTLIIGILLGVFACTVWALYARALLSHWQSWQPPKPTSVYNIDKAVFITGTERLGVGGAVSRLPLTLADRHVLEVRRG